jgi:hypothetical protein
MKDIVFYSLMGVLALSTGSNVVEGLSPDGPRNDLIVERLEVDPQTLRVQQYRHALSYRPPIEANWSAEAIDERTGEVICHGASKRPATIEDRHGAPLDLSLDDWVGAECDIEPGQTFSIHGHWWWTLPDGSKGWTHAASNITRYSP